MEPNLSKTADLFTLAHTRAFSYLNLFPYPWEALCGLSAFFAALLPTLGPEFEPRGEGVFVHTAASVDPGARIFGPAVIGAGSEVRCGALLRGNVLLGEGCVVGNCSELKNAILFDGAKAPHFNYIGDSILGHRAHLGAGAVLSNLKSDGSEVAIAGKGTGLRKCGAFLGDNAEVGCNAVLCPGTVLGKRTSVYPLTMCRGVYPADCIVKGRETVGKRPRRED